MRSSQFRIIGGAEAGVAELRHLYAPFSERMKSNGNVAERASICAVLIAISGNLGGVLDHPEAMLPGDGHRGGSIFGGLASPRCTGIKALMRPPVERLINCPVRTTQ